MSVETPSGDARADEVITKIKERVVIMDKIDKMIARIMKERENLPDEIEGSFNEGFDCGTRLALDLLEEASRRKVLVVDDDPEIVELMVDVLERDGRFEVRTANSGYDAGVLTQEFRPDLMILDYMLPDVNGNVVCKTIRQNRAFEHMKIIIVSGVIKQDEIEQLKKVGADAFLKKPFSIDELVNEMAELLEI